MAGQSSAPVVSYEVLRTRMDNVRASMRDANVDVLLLSVGADLPYLTGYEAMPLERLTMLVLPVDDAPTLVVPRLEVARVTPHDDLFSIHGWNETDDPCDLVAKLAGPVSVAAIGDRTWAQFLVELQHRMTSVRFTRASTITSSLRARKDAAEVAALRKAGAAADRVAAQLQGGDIELVGRSEAQVSADISARLIAEGHDIVNFAIVAAGENAASCHHEPGARVIAPNEIVLCDFGGTMAGYCSDITRCVSVGEPASQVRDAYAVLHEAQHAAVHGAHVGLPCEEVDAIGRRIISEHGYGDYFIHRIGHGIGLEAHEDPYMVSGNREVLAAGHAFSVEPGIYINGAFGMRLEDIVVASDDGPMALNHANHDLVVI
jgi:Xaa-Pro aminopeptidase